MRTETLAIITKSLENAIKTSTQFEYNFDHITQKERVSGMNFDLYDFLNCLDSFSWEEKKFLIIRLLNRNPEIPITLKEKLTSIAEAAFESKHEEGE